MRLLLQAHPRPPLLLPDRHNPIIRPSRLLDPLRHPRGILHDLRPQPDHARQQIRPAITLRPEPRGCAAAAVGTPEVGARGEKQLGDGAAAAEHGDLEGRAVVAAAEGVDGGGGRGEECADQRQDAEGGRVVERLGLDCAGGVAFGDETVWSDLAVHSRNGALGKSQDRGGAG